jgi:hypothetical protein
MRGFVRIVFALIAIFVVLQVVRPSIPSKPATSELQAPPEVKRILEKDCYSCHSDQVRLSWFDQIVPAYWLVRHDIVTAREHLDFSTLGNKPAAVQKATLYEAVNMMQLGAMPLAQFVRLHPEARVTPEDLTTLKAYLSPWAVAANAPDHSTASTPKISATRSAFPEQIHAPISLASVQPELNGFQFDSMFENWKPLSTTDRGDNNTFRFILGNDIAVKAAQSGDISPWPDGARFAKIAWQQEIGADGLVHPGKFVQVELMAKDAQRYKATDGWGWGRWRGLDLKPYGTDARFVNECTGCHMPVRGDDYVYTLPITSANVTGNEVVNKNAAELPATLPYHPLGWSAIAMYVDPIDHTTATLYGNEAAMQAVNMSRANLANGSTGPAYYAGAVLALVVWTQRDDPHWYGGRIPNVPVSVEFVQVPNGKQGAVYRRFAGIGLTEQVASESMSAERTKFMLGLSPVQLP